MPWTQHIVARHAAWGSRALQWMTSDPNRPQTRRGITMTQPMWTPLASALLTRMRPNAHPAHNLLRVMHDKLPPAPSERRNPIPGGGPWECGPADGGPMARMTNAMAAIGPLTRFAAVAPEPGPWCSSIPLWHNPGLHLSPPLDPTHPLFLVAALPNLRTLGDLAQLRFNLHSRQRFDTGSIQRASLRHAVEFLWMAVPAVWRNALPTPTTLTSLPVTPNWGHAPRMILGCMGWQQSNTKARVLHLNVRRGTMLQLQPVRSLRHHTLLRHISSSSPPPTALPQDTLQHLRITMASMWKIQWEPQNKETFWRLVNNGISGAGGHDVSSSRPCPCGWHPPAGPTKSSTAADNWREHAFWDCKVAREVVNEINHAIAAEPLQRFHLWLSIPPPSHTPILAPIWQVVSLAALTAMEHGRRAMYAMTKNPQQPPPTRHLSRHQPPPTPIPTQAANAASARFWCLLQDFADTGMGKTSPPSHPFLATRGGHLTLNLPPPVRLPADLD